MVKPATRAVLSWVLSLAALLVATVVLMESGFERLRALNVDVGAVQERETLLAQLLAAVHEAEASHRGLLLTGHESQARSYESARARADQSLDRLREHYSSIGAQDELRFAAALRELMNLRFEQMERAVEAYRSRGLFDAITDPRYLSGLEVMTHIRDRARALEAQEADTLVGILAAWVADLDRTRWTLRGAILTSILLMLAFALFVKRRLRRSARETADLRRELEERTQELTAASTYLQQVVEREKRALSHALQDALGGPLVATKMDVVWLRNRLRTTDSVLEERWDRIQRQLDQGVDFKRRVVEQLRPTLLDHVGLFTALRWLFQDTGGRAGVQVREYVPDAELQLSEDAAICLYRVAQEALTDAIENACARHVVLRVTVTHDRLHMAILDDGRGIAGTTGPNSRGHGPVSRRQRVRSLGGTVCARRRASGGNEIHVEVPLERILEPAAPESTTPLRACR